MSAVAAQLAAARTLLFVPGNRPERFDKAIDAGADAVIVDLEDAVPLAAKDAARRAVAERWDALSERDVPLVLRINPLGSELAAEDVALAATLPGIAGLMCPKAEDAPPLAALQARLGGMVALLPLIESAAGLDAVKAIAAAPGVLRLVVGHIDFMVDTGIAIDPADDSEAELAPLRFAVAMATRLAGLAPAVDGVTVQTGDDARLRADTRRARRFGFGGKLCIHPRQVAVVHETLAPTEAELAWARRVLEADAAAGGAAVQLDGRMVDLPVVLQARRTLALARTPGE
jgi:citrate lyase subunit beta/citryl-CoA lyase